MMLRPRHILALMFMAPPLVLVGCGDDGKPIPTEAGVSDIDSRPGPDLAKSPDAPATADAGTMDTGTVDTGTMDTAVPLDTGASTDGGTVDMPSVIDGGASVDGGSSVDSSVDAGTPPVDGAASSG
jgi:hypothetical protein